MADAMRIEWFRDDCMMIYDTIPLKWNIEKPKRIYLPKFVSHDKERTGYYSTSLHVGCPPNLSRVLKFLGKDYGYEYGNIVGLWDYDEVLWEWKFGGESGLEYNLWNQSEELQDKIAFIAWWK